MLKYTLEMKAMQEEAGFQVKFNPYLEYIPDNVGS